MKIVKTCNLVEGQVLGQEITSDSGVVLIPEKTVLKKEYINKLIEMNYDVVFIDEDNTKEINADDEKIIFENCVNKFKETIEVYFSTDSSKLMEIKNIAITIIENVIKSKEVLVNINELRENDEMKYNHSMSVTSMAVIFALHMGMKEEHVREIAVGSILHDIGFSIVNSKINNNLSDDVNIDIDNEIKKHVIYGYSMVQNEKWLSTTSKNIILLHHERIDGSGYPFHRKGEQTDIASKIVAVCDEFDKLVYERKIKVHKAIEKIMSEAGITLDLEVVKVFVEIIAAYPVGSYVLTNQDEIGIVLRQNNKCPTRPVIRIFSSINQKKCDDRIEDLTKNLTLFIRDTLEKDEIDKYL